MLSTTWCPWEDNRVKVEVKAENQDRGYKKPVHSKETQQLILKSFCYFCKSISKKYVLQQFIFSEFAGWSLYRLQSIKTCRLY